jgi:hypothetical protein
MSEELTKKQLKELTKLAEDITEEAKVLVGDYTENPSDISGSVFHIHENSPYLATELESDEPLYSGSRWTKVLRTQ